MSKFLDSTGLSYTVTHIKDYIDKNKITVNDSTLTITNDGTTLGTFTSNQSSDATIDIPIQDKLDIETFNGIITTKSINLTCPGDGTSGIITKVIRSINSINILMLVYNLKGNYYSFDCASDTLKSKYIGKFYEYNNKIYIVNSIGSLVEIGSISVATSSKLGGIKVGYTTTGKNYKVQLDESYNAYVNVPWQNTTYSKATSSSLGLIKTGYGSSGYNYALNVDDNGAGYVTLNAATSTSMGLVNLFDYTKSSWSGVSSMSPSGTLEVGARLDFHATIPDTNDYAVRLACPSVTGIDVILPSASGTLALEPTSIQKTYTSSTLSVNLDNKSISSVILTGTSSSLTACTVTLFVNSDLIGQNVSIFNNSNYTTLTINLRSSSDATGYFRKRTAIASSGSATSQSTTLTIPKAYGAAILSFVPRGTSTSYVDAVVW